MNWNNCIQFQILGLMASLVIFIAKADAQTNSEWTGSNGIWSDSSNWSSGVPDGDFNAILSVPSVAIVQDISALEIAGLEFSQGSAELVLDHDLSVTDELQWSNSSISGVGKLRFQGNGNIEGGVLNTTLENSGQVTLTGNPCITTSDEATWINEPGATMVLAAGAVVGGFPNEQAASIVNEFGAVFRQPAATASANYVLWDMVNDGTIEVSPGGQFLFVKDFFQSESGEINLNGGGLDFFQAVTLNGKISGSGFLANVGGAGFDVDLVPGGGEIGALEVAGSFNMTPQTALNVQIGPAGTADNINNIGGPVHLNGVINIEALAGAAPGTYDLMGWNNGSGFSNDDIQLGSVPIGFEGSLVVDAVSRSLQLQVLDLPEFVNVESLNVVFGHQFGGNLSALAASDDQRLEFQSGGNSFPPMFPVAVEFTSFVPADSPTSLKLEVESSVTAPGLQQRIDLYNFLTSRFESVTSAAMSSFDSTVIAEASGDLPRFVEEETGRVIARIAFVRSEQFNHRRFRARFDKIVWAVEY